jgi:hypothetical protein
VFVKARFRSSRFFSAPAQIDEFLFDPIPSRGENTEGILRYGFFHATGSAPELDKLAANSIGQTESQMWLAFFSLSAASNIAFRGALINDEDSGSQRLKYSFARQPPIDFALVQQHYERLAQIQGRNRLRFINSARSYQSAVSQMDSNPTVSFFLFVVAIECLSNFVIDAGSSRKKFIRFIDRYLDSSLSAEKSDQAKFEERLDVAYRIRNAFVHRGQSIPNAVAIADRANVPSAIYYDRGTRRRAPGLIWLQKIVRATLLGFLWTVTQEHPSNPRKPVFRSLAKRANIIRVVAAAPLQKGDPITLDKLMLD